MEDYRSSESIPGHHLPNFETLDAKIAKLLKKLLSNNFRKKVFVEEQNAHNESSFFEGDKWPS